ncbi:hypothetical protein [Aquimarina algicola]|uniref:DUF1772 domain-containing protein n=1 Tax=Aquimarina algicola TaxID=2589995 RepID=A0A504J9U4_9FLAO|nr:hypothetical protein [Aquimarina algicola]TPN87706.1 hypothetical protein FHK87_09010 [Aquimarina algicola]
MSEILLVTRLLLDFGLLVLIWIVQLIIYPGFAYYTQDQLLIWHSKYTTFITIIVMPLMLGQLALYSIQLFLHIDVYVLIIWVLIVLIWSATFLQAVPLHNKIAQNKNKNNIIVNKLIKINWLRTVLWTMVFAFSVLSAIF